MNRKKLTRMAGVLALPVALALLALPPTPSGDTDGRAASQDYFPFLQSLPSLPQDATAASTGQPAPHRSVAVATAGTLDPAKVARLEAQVRQMRAQGATDDEVYRTRAARLSPEAAAELARMEREEAIWKQRVSAYLAERNLLSSGATSNAGSGAGNSAGTADEQLRQLREARFTQQEQIRLEAHETAGPALVSP